MAEKTHGYAGASKPLRSNGGGTLIGVASSELRRPYRLSALISSLFFAITASISACVGGSLGDITKSETVFGFRAVPAISLAMALFTSMIVTLPICTLANTGPRG